MRTNISNFKFQTSNHGGQVEDGHGQYHLGDNAAGNWYQMQRSSSSGGLKAVPVNHLEN